MPKPFFTYREWYIPDRMGGGIERYVKHGIKPGDFLTAVIENDLHMTLSRADDENLKNLSAYVGYFYNEVPQSAWGSKAKMNAWMKHKGLEGSG